MSATVSLTVRLQTGLNHPSLVLRCQEVSRILQEVSSKDASNVLRVVIESIFGAPTRGDYSVTMGFSQSNEAAGGGWGIKVITMVEHRPEFEAMRLLLSPQGPLLSLVYRVAQDPFQLLPFPIACLPARVRSELEDGTAGPFFMSKIQNLGPGKPPVNILLNAFEFYIFHFAHFLLAAHSQRWSLVWMATSESLYPTLLEDYLLAFLPCDGSLPPPPMPPPGSSACLGSGFGSPVSSQIGGPKGCLSPLPYSGGYPGSQQLHLSSIVSPIPSYYGARSPDHFNYHGPDGVIRGVQTSSPVHSQSYQAAARQTQGDLNVWTTQSVSQILVEMWIISCIPSSKASMAIPSTPAQPNSATNSLPALMEFSRLTSDYGVHPELRALGAGIPFEYVPHWHEPLVQDVFLPSSDHVRVVRILVKHFHYFSNSIKPNQPSPLDNLRRAVWPMCRRNLYLFLRHMFLHWPLDSSFRLVLETWVSYIQPWRYSTLDRRHMTASPAMADDVRGSPTRKWLPFLCDNLLFYTSLFLLFLRRIKRLDLAAPKNAHIVFRVSKVFSQENLIAMLQEVEDSFEGGAGFQSPVATASSKHHSQSSELSPHSMGQLVRQHILEVEGPNYQYVPITCHQTIKEVTQLVKLIRGAHDAVSEELQQITKKPSSDHPQTSSASNHIGAWLMSAAKSLFEGPTNKDGESSQEEMRKSINHLKHSMDVFCCLFNITIPTKCGTFTSTVDGHYNSFNESHSPKRMAEKAYTSEHLLKKNEPFLTEFGRVQLLNGMKRLDLEYLGNPDLQPVRSFECGPLVELMYYLSTKINQKYGNDIKLAYFRNDIGGRLARTMLMPPQTIYEYPQSQTSIVRTRVPQSLSPRISLRRCANIHIIGFMVFVSLFLWMFSFSFIKFGFKIVFPIFLCWVVFNIFQQSSTVPDSQSFAKRQNSESAQHFEGRDLSVNEEGFQLGLWLEGRGFRG